MQLQLGPALSAVVLAIHLLDKRRQLPVDLKALEAEPQQRRRRQVFEVNPPHQPWRGIGQCADMLQRLLVEGRCRPAQAPQQCRAALPFQRQLMGMLPGPLAVMQQCRPEGCCPRGVGNTPLVEAVIEFNPIVFAIHFDVVGAVVAEHTLGICCVAHLASGFMLVVFQLFVPQPCRAVIASDGDKRFKMVSGGLTETPGCRAHGDTSHDKSCVDRNIPADIQQMLTGVIDIALRPILHPLIHFLQHFTDGHRQHQVTQHRHKQRGHIDQ